MRQTLLAATLLGALALSSAASAQTAVSQIGAPAPSVAPDSNAPVGKAAGTFMVRVRAIGVFPENWGSSISGIGGHVSATNTAAPEIDFSYFLTDNWALELIAATTKHTVTATGTAAGNVDVGSVWVLPPTLLVQYHFMPHERFSPYVGVGLNATFFYASHPAGGIVTSVGYTNNIGAAIQAGFDYNFSGHWFANFDVKQIFVSTNATINGGAVNAHTWLNPTVVGAGIGYRF